jgi:hypothetical protein
MVLRNVGIHPHDYTASQPEDHDMNLRRRENLKFRTLSLGGQVSYPYKTTGTTIVCLFQYLRF